MGPHVLLVCLVPWKCHLRYGRQQGARRGVGRGGPRVWMSWRVRPGHWLASGMSTQLRQRGPDAWLATMSTP